MREILFRGKEKTSGEWKFGTYKRNYHDGSCVGLHPFDDHYIVDCSGQQQFICHGIDYDASPYIYEVDPETIGQFTGLKDRNGVRIFEGDILFVPRLGKAYEVKYVLGQFYVGINQPIAYERHSGEVIGNIHDNPELLEGGCR